MHHHRSGKLKQGNKKHKQPAASKRLLDRRNQGKVNRAPPKAADRARAVAKGKADRLNRTRQLRENKKSAWLVDRRLGAGGGHGPPKVVVFIGLSDVASSTVARDMFLASATTAVTTDTSESVGSPVTVTFAAPRYRATLFDCKSRELMTALHFAKLADVVVVTVSAAEGQDGLFDPQGSTFLTALKAQGLPAVVGLIQGLDTLPAKKQSDMKRYCTRFFTSEFGDDVKIAQQGTTHQLVRAVATAKARPLQWRVNHPYVVAQAVEFIPTHQALAAAAAPAGLATGASAEAGTGAGAGAGGPASVAGAVGGGIAAAGPDVPATVQLGTLVVRGYLQGRPLNCRQLVHIPEVGTFQIGKIAAPSDPCPLSKELATAAATAASEAAVAIASAGSPASPALPSPPTAVRCRVVPSGSAAMEPTVAEADDEDKEPLETLAEPSTTAGEQTWPTEEELKEAEDAEKKAKGKWRKGKPGREYSSAWLLDSDESSGDDSDGDEVGAGAGVLGAMEVQEDVNMSGKVEEGDSDAEFDDSASTGSDISYADDGDLATEHRRADVIRKTKLEEAEAEDREFPDEIDTPKDVPARERFGRYRGLQSFRTSYWNPKESLPTSYARIFQFPNFQRTQRRVLEEGEKAEQTVVSNETKLVAAEKSVKSSASTTGGRSRASSLSGAGASASASASSVAFDASISAGSVALSVPDADSVGEGWVRHGEYISIHIPNVPLPALQARDKTIPLVIGSLLKHENRTSVLHFNVNRHGEYTDVIRSKDYIEFHVGFRRFDARTIFSQHNLGSDKHKFERFFRPGAWCVASVLGPITFGPCPVLMFKRLPDGTSTLVGSGTVMSADPDRIILKKYVLSGYPVKVKRRNAVVKYMFWNPEDIRWFKGIELWTKYGHSGHIREPVGTHGTMKCVFNGHVKNNDTVCMSLYKRVYPKWGECYRPFVGEDDLREHAA